MVQPLSVVPHDSPASDTLVTRPGGTVRLANEATRHKLAIYSSGAIFVARAHAHDPDVVSALALARRIGITVRPPQLVDVGVIRRLYEEEAESTVEAQDAADDMPTVMRREILEMLREAASLHASDVHIVVERGQANVWYRIDGERRPIENRHWKGDFGLQLCRTVSVIASDSGNFGGEYREAAYQAGRVSDGLPAGVQAVRLQWNPVGYGGRQLVMRLLYAEQSVGASLATLGFSEEHREALKILRSHPTGITVVSGPTGSGKSTTLERNLSQIVQDYPGAHVMSVEDPPEYTIKGVVQLPVASDAENDEDRQNAYVEAIAAAMRSDPDRIMVGEVRTHAAAQAALRAALTGHAVYTTVHANDALAVIARMIDIGVEPFMLRDTSLMRGIVAQRLVRRLCPQCRREAGLDALPGDMAERLTAALSGILDAPLERVFLPGDGCSHCREGYAGRTVVAEVILPDQTLLDLLVAGDRTAGEAYWRGQLNGKTMMDHGLDKVVLGEVDPIELEAKVGRI